MVDTIAVGILGATGTVGQRFIQILEKHPFLKVTVIGASPRSAGKAYKDTVNWKQISPIPDAIANLVVQESEPQYFKGCKIVFSGLDSAVAHDIELAFSKDFAVFSNARNHRMVPLVPLCVPYVNPDHMDIIAAQRAASKTNGFIVTNANCSTTGLVVALAALRSLGELDKVFVTTMQAISGAGYPGVPSLDIFDNVIPFISGEEEKMESETLKILSSLKNNTFVSPEIVVSASCNRVPVLDGHTMSVSVSFKNAKITPEDVRRTLQNFRFPEEKRTASYAEFPIIVREEPNRPQPRVDRESENGMAVTVGRIRKCPILQVKFSLLVHNTILGAAGSSILNAEEAVKKGLIH